MVQSGNFAAEFQCPLLGVKLTSAQRIRSRRIDVGDLNHFAPLRDFVSDERAKVSWGATQRYTANIGETLFYLGIGEDRVDLMIELVDDCRWCVLWCTDSVPNGCFEARHKFCHSRNVWQGVRAHRAGYCESA